MSPKEDLILGEDGLKILYTSQKEISLTFLCFPKRAKHSKTKWHIICFLKAKVFKEGPKWVYMKIRA